MGKPRGYRYGPPVASWGNGNGYMGTGYGSWQGATSNHGVHGPSNGMPAWYCIRCGAQHFNMTKAECRICGHAKPASKGTVGAKPPGWPLLHMKAAPTNGSKPQQTGPAMSKQAQQMMQSVKQQILQRQKEEAATSEDVSDAPSTQATTAGSEKVAAGAATQDKSSKAMAGQAQQLLQQLGVMGLQGEHLEALKQQASQHVWPHSKQHDQTAAKRHN